MRYSYKQEPKSKLYEVVKVSISAVLLVVSIWLLVRVPAAWMFGGVCIAAFLTLLDGLKKLLTNKDELKFLKIGDDSICFRRFEGGTIDTIRAKSVEVVVITPTYLQIGTEGVSHMLHVEHGSGSQHELADILRGLVPDCVIKETEDYED